MKNNFLTSICKISMLSVIFISCESEETGVQTADAISNIAITSGEKTESNLDNFLLLDLVNEVRTKGCDCKDQNGSVTKMPPVNRLTWNDALTKAAKLHSEDMEKNNYFSHTNQKNQSFSDRITAVGYIWSSVSENIAKGQKTEKAVFDAWMNSYGHCKNIMGSSVKEMGVARTKKDTFYWTQLFGTQRNSAKKL